VPAVENAGEKIGKTFEIHGGASKLRRRRYVIERLCVKGGVIEKRSRRCALGPSASVMAPK
jgi:hypothetical protein